MGKRMPPSVEFATISVGTTLLSSLAHLGGAGEGIIWATAGVIAITFGYELLRSIQATNLSSNVMVLARGVSSVINNDEELMTKNRKENA